MSSSCAIYVDAGTTNMRVWLVLDREILAFASAMVGVRDTAKDGSPARLKAAFHDLIAQVTAQAGSSGCTPAYVAAAGMITSPLGLAEVPHVSSPAGVKELAANIRQFNFPDVTELPVLLVPGVRTGPRETDLDSIEISDQMRGEATLCVGLLAMGLAPAPCTVINLGSHWKLIQIDDQGRIAGSLTSLTGEMIHTTQTQTILASAVPQIRPESLDQSWIDAGMREQRSSGLA